MQGYVQKESKETRNHFNQNTSAEPAAQRMAISETSAEGAEVRDMPYPDGLSGSPSSIKPLSKGAKNNHLETDISQRRFGINKEGMNALNERASRESSNMGIRRMHDLFSGITNVGSHLAETGFSKRDDILASERLTNQAVLDDNEQYFLRNLNGAKTNLSRLMIAKIEMDRDLNNTFSDFFSESGKWSQEDPSVIMKEMYSRLEKSSTRNQPSYAVLLKMIDGITKLESDQKIWQEERLKKIQENTKNLIEQREKALLDINTFSGQSDNEPNTKLIISLLGEVLPPKGEYPQSVIGGMVIYDASLKDYLISKKEDPSVSMNTDHTAKITQLINMIENSDYGIGIGSKKLSEASDDYYAFKDIEEHFVNNHNGMMAGATEGVKQFYNKTDENAMGILAYLTDKKASVGLDDDTKNNLDDAINSALARMLSDDELKALPVDPAKRSVMMREARENLEGILKKNKEIFEYIYDPSKDMVNTYSKYNPLAGTPLDRKNDDAMAILRDGIYLAGMKTIDKYLSNNTSDEYDEKSSIYQKVYGDNGGEQSLFTTAIDANIRQIKPNSTEVNDLFNGYLLLQKTASSEMDEYSAEALVESEAFSRSSVFSISEKEELLKMGVNFARESEKVNEKELYASPESNETKLAIQELAVINAARIYEQKGNKNPFENAQRYFFQNNEAIYNFNLCMDGANNPTTSVETTPSLANKCFDKLEKDLHEDAQKANRELSGGAMVAMNPFAFLLALRLIASEVALDMLAITRYNLSHEISDTVSYLENSEDRLQAVSRFLNIESEYAGEAGTFVKAGHQNRVINDAENEATAFELSTSTDLLSDEIVLASIGATSNDNSEKLRKSLFEQSIDRMFNDVDGKIKFEKSNLAKTENMVLELGRQIIEQKNLVAEESAKAKDDIDPEKIKAIEKNINTLKSNLVGYNNTIARINEDLAFLGKKDIDAFKERMNNKSSIKLTGMSPREKLDTLELLGEYRESLYEHQFKNIKDGKSNKQIEGEIAKLSKVIPILQRDVLSSNAVAKIVIVGEIRDKYSATLGKDIQDKISKNGLTSDVIKDIISELSNTEKYPNMSKSKLINIQSELGDIKRTMFLLGDVKKDVFGSQYRMAWEKGGANASIVSSFLRKVSHHNKGIMGKIHNSNDLYASTGEEANGQVYVYASKRMDGYLKSKVNRLYEQNLFEEAERLSSDMVAHNIGSKISKKNQEYIAKHHGNVGESSKDVQNLRLHNNRNTKGVKPVNRSKAPSSRIVR